MSISSMTGFARTNGNISLGENIISWIWEIKSVNAKSLDLKYKLPTGFDDLALQLKQKTSEYLTRGSINAYLEINYENTSKTITIDEDLLNKITNTAISLCQKHREIAMPTAGELLSQKGIIEIKEASLSEEDMQILKENILKDYLKACKNLQSDRQKEGAKIKEALCEILQKISEITTKIETVFNTLPEKIKEKLNNQIKNLIQDITINDERLAQEVVLLITKADIKEEIDRLKTHIKSAYNLLDSNNSVGRRLDFLCQELNREANTTCSKAADISITDLGMDLKALIEQFREQVQNIE